MGNGDSLKSSRPAMLRPNDVLRKAMMKQKQQQQQFGHRDTGHVVMPDSPHGQGDYKVFSDDDSRSSIVEEEDEEEVIEVYQVQRQDVDVDVVPGQHHLSQHLADAPELHERDSGNSHRYQTANLLSSVVNKTDNNTNNTNTNTNTNNTTYNININKVKSLHVGDHPRVPEGSVEGARQLLRSRGTVFLSWTARILFSLVWHWRACIMIGVAFMAFRCHGFLSSTIWSVIQPFQWTIQAMMMMIRWSGQWSGRIGGGLGGGGVGGGAGGPPPPPRITLTPRPEPSIPRTVDPIATALPPLLWHETIRGSRKRIQQLDHQQQHGDGRAAWHLTDLVGQLVDQTAAFSADLEARVALFMNEHERRSNKILQRVGGGGGGGGASKWHGGSSSSTTLALLQRQEKEVQAQVQIQVRAAAEAEAARLGKGRAGWTRYWASLTRIWSSSSSATTITTPRPHAMGKNDDTGSGGGALVRLATHAHILRWLDDLDALLLYEKTSMRGWLQELRNAHVGETASKAASEMCVRAKAARRELRDLEAAQAGGVDRRGGAGRGSSSSSSSSSVDDDDDASLQLERLAEIRSTATTGCIMGKPCQDFSKRQLRLLRESVNELEDRALAKVEWMREEVLGMIGGEVSASLSGWPWWGAREEREARRIVKVQEGHGEDVEGNHAAGGISDDEDGDDGAAASRSGGRGDRYTNKLMTGEVLNKVKLGIYEVLKARRDAHQHIFSELVGDAANPGR